ncbi:hypothetical protein H072_8802 [Dactylellina haptotyla CBS 200.50]|uniref:Copper acquisition factor BIM1-like domain-containing protein n=1 Tax=Dactylellina haptotyla (strain CBS 200.50) TaxID=1284197 RepID=S8BQI3_DACHA|nr:hypothetical protein H072_8802 [Dactylellina haptotyla CBS 200.50]
MHFKNLLLLGVFGAASAHFILEVPESIGFDDDNEGIFPCGGFDQSHRAGLPESPWPKKGAPIGVVTTHNEAIWEFKAAVVPFTNRWVSLSRNITQTAGLGSVCFSNIPGPKNPLWYGRKGVIQIAQHGHDGTLYQVSSDFTSF